MTRIRKKTWLGNCQQGMPRDPDAVLAHLLEWQRGTQKNNTATCAYPEPINLTAASAWRKFPKITDCNYAFIYYDAGTRLWIKAMAINEVGIDDIDLWQKQELQQGCELIWINRRAEAERPAMTLNDQDDEPGTMNNGIDQISLTVRLQQMDKYRVGDTDLVELLPNKFKIKDVNNIPGPRERIPRGKLGPRPKREYNRQAKPVITPLGMFDSASAAAKHYGVSITWVATRASINKQGFRYITREEYEQRLSQPNA